MLTKQSRLYSAIKRFIWNMQNHLHVLHAASPNGSPSDILQQLNVRITPRTICEISTLAGVTEYGLRTVSGNDPKFCAGGILGHDSCNVRWTLYGLKTETKQAINCNLLLQGDSGGPLVCLQNDGSYFLHGLVSYGTTDCGLHDRPGIYTKVNAMERVMWN